MTDSELSKALEGMVDVFTGRVDFPAQEIQRHMMKSPEKLILIIEKKEDGYYSTIYVTEKDFKGKF